jgi:hypothetical protein
MVTSYIALVRLPNTIIVLAVQIIFSSSKGAVIGITTRTNS